jgi:hypothetical protein
MTSILPRGSIGFLTRSLVGQRGTGDKSRLSEQDWDDVEILVGFTGYNRPAEEFVKNLGIPVLPDQEILDLELGLVKAVVQRNEGMMKFEADGKRKRTFISLRLPVERRGVFLEIDSDRPTRIAESPPE